MKDVLIDIVLFVGFASLVSGVWLMYPPAALVVAGLILMVSSLVLGHNNGHRTSTD